MSFAAQLGAAEIAAQGARRPARRKQLVSSVAGVGATGSSVLGVLR